MKNKTLQYLLLRLCILALCIGLIYHFAIYFLPQNIQEDQFSFVGELSLVVNLVLVFSFSYSGFIYWEYQRFRKKAQLEFSKASLLILVMSLIIVIASLFFTLKL